MKIDETVMSLLQKKYSFSPDVDLVHFNYIESGFVDSIGIIQFIAELEDIFSIEFTDEETMSPEFSTVGGVIRIIEEKVKRNEES